VNEQVSERSNEQESKPASELAGDQETETAGV